MKKVGIPTNFRYTDHAGSPGGKEDGGEKEEEEEEEEGDTTPWSPDISDTAHDNPAEDRRWPGRGEDDGSDSGVSSEDVDMDSILEDLTPCDVRVLVHSEEELTQCETFERIFPTASTGHYLAYTSTNYYDLLLLAWEKRYAGCRQDGRDRVAQLTAKGVHLEVPPDQKLEQPPLPREPGPKKRTIIVPKMFRK